MPLYEYQCQNCQKVTEKMQKFSDPLLTECPHCKGKLEKLLSLTSFSLKGSGWYVTDYKKSKSTASPSSGKTESAQIKPETSEKKTTETSSSTSSSDK